MSSPPPTLTEAAQDKSTEESNSLLDLDKNEDYQLVLKALDILKKQLKIATDDVETLRALKTEALQDPYAFVVDLKQRKKPRKAPPPLQKVVAVPPIDWNKYRFVPESRLTQQHNAIQSLTQYYQANKSSFCNIIDTPMPAEYNSTSTPSANAQYMQQELAKATFTLSQMPSRANSVSDFSDDEEEGDAESVVGTKTTPQSMTRPRQTYSKASHAGKGIGKRRASMMHTGMDLHTSSMEVSETESHTVSRLQSIEPRTPDDCFSMDSTDSNSQNNATFKQPWSDEEQKRLQELLVIYPDEPVQAQRFNKISKALGTRTPRQVASRVQKYFIKLAKLGLPVPGRITIPPSSLPKGERPKTKIKNKPKSNQNRVPRTSGMGYNSIVSGGITNSRISGAHYSNAQGPPAIFMSDEENDLNVAEMMKSVQNPNENTTSSELVIHEGYACDGCGTEPIVGVRYKCTVCDVSEEVDLCGHCMEKGTFTNDHHTVDHTFEAVRTANPFPYYADNDYKSPEHLGEYSYLGF